MKRTLALLLSVTMLSSLISCQKDVTKTSNDTTASPTTETAAETLTSNDDRLNTVFEQDFGGRDINFLYQADFYYGTNESEISYTLDDIDGDVLKDAVYKRQQQVESGLGVKLNSNIVTFSGGFMTQVQKEALSGDGSIDSAIGYKRYLSQKIPEGLFYNLRSLDSIDLEGDYWDNIFNQFYSFNDRTKQYLATGDILYNDNYTSEIYYFNEDLAKEYKLGDLYLLVREGKWTLSKLEELLKGVSDDLDGSGKMDTKDQYGLSINQSYLQQSLASVDLPCVIPDNSGKLDLTYDLIGEKYISAAETIYNIAHSPDTLFVEKMGDDYNKRNQMINNGQFLFWKSAIGLIKNLRSVDSFDFGILPNPKLTEEQENYITLGGPLAAVISILTGCKDPDAVGYVLEALAITGQKYVTPIAIETQILDKATRSEDARDMLVLAFENVTCDMVDDLGLGNYYSITCQAALAASFDFTSRMEKNAAKIEKALADFIDEVGKLQ